MMSVRIAQRQAADVNVRNSSSFAEFTDSYQQCDAIREEGALEVAHAPSPQEAARLWLALDENLRQCAGQATEARFAPHLGE